MQTGEGTESGKAPVLPVRFLPPGEIDFVILHCVLSLALVDHLRKSAPISFNAQFLVQGKVIQQEVLGAGFLKAIQVLLYAHLRHFPVEGAKDRIAQADGLIQIPLGITFEQGDRVEQVAIVHIADPEALALPRSPK